MASELRYMVGSMSEDLATLDWTASDRSQQTGGATAEAGTVVRY